MKTTIEIENLKCHGCANTISKGISAMEGVNNVIVDHETSSVTIEYDGNNERMDEFAEKLRSLGYPKAGENSTGRKIKSYVSCAIGRIDSNKNK
ncbi:MAG: hypothetical protein A2W93_06550 [Bacteroidetes bacterium GWF2_43_63]|nr:MAG: hypothetical protein A2W94_07985 [Bacteroidetes bacterium GWE2_42_42]OFY53279.1 MAG: hypothetical protein A2W93_06550 [Bacteroidetes bacterium GWF2_43_63]HBG71727.1 heavy metal transporter [Bacteroidales bacterium]HCB61608.1 heavy metal transporter [Bacteroidales bacterium]HCY22820.1 heavy metal transporter [Bacteroidales bacterium]